MQKILAEQVIVFDIGWSYRPDSNYLNTLNVFIALFYFHGL